MSVLPKGMPRMGLQSRFFAAILVLLGIVVVVMLLLWQRQQASQHEVSEVTRTGCAGLVMSITGTPGFTRGGASGLANSALAPIVA